MIVIIIIIKHWLLIVATIDIVPVSVIYSQLTHLVPAFISLETCNGTGL